MSDFQKFVFLRNVFDKRARARGMMGITLGDELRIYERECIHRASGADGHYISGEIYVRSLLKLGATAAVDFAKNINSFFWSDAPRMKVWLCQTCARRLGLLEEQ